MRLNSMENNYRTIPNDEYEELIRIKQEWENTKEKRITFVHKIKLEVNQNNKLKVYYYKYGGVTNLEDKYFKYEEERFNRFVKIIEEHAYKRSFIPYYTDMDNFIKVVNQNKKILSETIKSHLKWFKTLSFKDKLKVLFL